MTRSAWYEGEGESLGWGLAYNTIAYHILPRDTVVLQLVHSDL